MAKGKKATESMDEAELMAKLAMDSGCDVLADLDSVKYFFDTGNLAVNFVLSGRFIKGGIPGNKITEVYGPSSSGKSLLASNALYGCQKIGGASVILDCENATNGEFMAKTSHLNLKTVLRATPMSLESAFLKIHNITRRMRETFGPDKPLLFVYDSISVSPCERELKETSLPDGYKAADWKKLVGRKEQPGERAKVCSAELRKLQAVLEPQNITVLIINQTREKIGVLYGSPETTAGGGNALPFYASCRFRTATRKKIENKRLDTFAGVNMHVKNVKNRTFRPYVETQGVQLFFDNGINPISGLLSCLIESERVAASSPGNYYVMPDYLPEGLAEYKFKASKVRNDVPLELILNCPALVDAADRAEVEAYIAPFMNAINNSLSDDFEEKAVASEESDDFSEEWDA